MKYRIVIYGIGTYFENQINKFQSEKRKEEFLASVIALSDGNEKRHGEKLYGKEIVNPESLELYAPDLFVIGTSKKFFYEIYEVLVCKYSAGKDSIIWIGDYIFNFFVSSVCADNNFDCRSPELHMDAVTTHSILTAVDSEHEIDYEPILKQTYSRFLRNGDTVLDIGAHDGYHTTEFNDLVGSDGNIFAFEPLPLQFSKLNERFNNPNVRIYNCALSDCEGEIDFHSFPNLAGLSGIKMRNTYKFDTEFNTEVNIIKVQSARLDSFIGEFKRIDYIKMDCEGAEISIISGGLKVIDAFRPIMSVEYGYGSYSYYDLTKSSLFELCEKLNYFIADIFGNIILTQQLWDEFCDSIYWDYFLIPKEKIKLFLQRINDWGRP